MLTAPDIYCVKCKQATGNKDVEAVTMKNNRPATKAVCVVCGGGKFRIGRLPVEAETAQS